MLYYIHAPYYNSKKLIKDDDFVLMPRKEYEKFVKLAKGKAVRVTEADVLR